MIGLVVLLLLALSPVFALIGINVVRRWLRRRRKTVDPVTRCVCGYEMDQLDTIRCPECGRVRGFDVTADDLGLTTEQLQRAKARRDARKAGEIG